MKLSKFSCQIASWSLILVGIGHTITDITTPIPPNLHRFIIEMKNFSISILGTSNNIFSFYQGFSFMMGLLLFAYGVLNLLLLKNNKQSNIPSNVLIFNITITFIALIISINYFFIVPIVFTGISFLGFTTSLLFKNKS